MPLTLTSKITLLLESLLENTVGVANVTGNHSRQLALSLASGVGLNQADRIYSETRTLAASANVTLDLSGVLLDIFGAAILFARLKAIILLPLAANVNNVVMGAAAATIFLGPLGGATHTIATAPGGMTCLVAPTAVGWSVGAGATDFLMFANGGAGTGVTYDLILIGASA